MQKPLLMYGSRGAHVVELQKQLNQWDKKENGTINPILETDGIFGANTRDMVKSFQLSMFLYKDGKVGLKTWSALLGVEMYNCFDLPGTFVPAPNQYQCWAGATAMLLGRSAPVRTEPPGVSFEQLPGGATGGLENSHPNMQKYANFHGIQMFKAQQLTCLQLCNLVDQFGRLMLNIKGVNSSMQNSSPQDSHLLVLAGLRGNGESSGTTVTLYNPSAVGFGGRVVTVSHRYLKSNYPNLTYQVFYKFSNSSRPI